jgi:hypothetical protein
MVAARTSGEGASQPGPYTITPLGSPQFPLVQPRAINRRGQIVGSMKSVPGGASQAFLWQPRKLHGAAGTLHTLPNLPGGAASYATDINSRGHVSGYSEDGQGTIRQVYWKPKWHETIPTVAIAFNPDAAPFLVGQFNATGGINRHGAIASNAGAYAHATLYQPGERPPLRDMDAGFQGAMAINDHGAFTGNKAGHAASQAACFIPDRPNGVSGPYFNIADTCQGGPAYAAPGAGVDINNSWEIVAHVPMPDSGNPAQSHLAAFLWRPTAATDRVKDLQNAGLDRLLDPTGKNVFDKSPCAINHSGQVVGTVDAALAFLYDRGEVYDLNRSTIRPAPWRQLSVAADLNDFGQIVGMGLDNTGRTGNYTGFLLTPSRQTRKASAR